VWGEEKPQRLGGNAEKIIWPWVCRSLKKEEPNREGGKRASYGKKSVCYTGKGEEKLTTPGVTPDKRNYPTPGRQFSSNH